MRSSGGSDEVERKRRGGPGGPEENPGNYGTYMQGAGPPRGGPETEVGGAKCKVQKIDGGLRKCGGLGRAQIRHDANPLSMAAKHSAPKFMPAQGRQVDCKAAYRNRSLDRLGPLRDSTHQILTNSATLQSSCKGREVVFLSRLRWIQWANCTLISRGDKWSACPTQSTTPPSVAYAMHCPPMQKESL
jgi:hypothetical protein